MVTGGGQFTGCCLRASGRWVHKYPPLRPMKTRGELGSKSLVRQIASGRNSDWRLKVVKRTGESDT